MYMYVPYHCSREKFDMLETVVKLSEEMSLSVIELTSTSAVDLINKIIYMLDYLNR